MASIKVVHHFIQRPRAVGYWDLLDQYPELADVFKGLLQQYRSQKRLDSEKAGLEYLPPDRVPFYP